MYHRSTNLDLSYGEEMNTKLLLIIICFFGLFVAGCSPANEQEAEQILSGAAQTTVAGVTIIPETPAATLDVNLIVTQTFAAMTAQAASQKPAATPQTPTATQTQPAPAATLPPAVASGGVSGQLMYPSSGIPALRIVAFQVGCSNIYHVDTALGKNTYELDGLPPATYRVVAYVLPNGGFTAGLSGGYSQMVPCGLHYGCNDHTLINVIVTAGHVTTGVDPNDYYAPQGTFPPDPIP